MTDYIGGTSLDAEIIVDLEKGEVLMDYSLNSLGNPFSSNTSTIISSEWSTAPFGERILYGMPASLLLFIGLIPMGLLVFIFTITSQYKSIRPGPSWQLRHQKLLKWYFENVEGVTEQSRYGELKDLVLVFTIPNNIWLTYDLEGEYNKKIRSVALMRNFITYYRFGRFKEVRQKGWNVVFTFSKPPKHGSCTIRYLLGS